MSEFFIRPATPADAGQMVELLNAIIAIGGSTAHQTPFTRERMVGHYISGPRVESCFVAEQQGSGLILGFQCLESSGEGPQDWCYSGTFARLSPKVPGVGTALFAASKVRAKELGFRAIIATIRADNESGLGYYSKMGFVDFKVYEAVPLDDGTKVDRISKRFDL